MKVDNRRVEMAEVALRHLSQAMKLLRKAFKDTDFDFEHEQDIDISLQVLNDIIYNRGNPDDPLPIVELIGRFKKWIANGMG